MSNYNDRPLAGTPTATAEQAKAWAKKNGAAQIMIDLAPLYWEYGKKIGINPVFSYCQTAYEQAFLTYKGCLLDASYKNTAGIKRSDAEIKEIMKKYPNSKSSDDIAECHMKFNSWEDSIKAQIDHAALYAGLLGYPKKYPNETTDPRHFDWCFGIGKTVLEWAPHYATNSYGDRLIAMMRDLENTKAETMGDGITKVSVNLIQLKDGMYSDCKYTEQIRAMQQLLIAKGFSCGTAGADGSFGANTEKAVKAFQKANGLGQDGICGIKTWSKLLGVSQ